MAGIKPIVEVKVEKDNVFSKIKHWWKYKLDDDERFLYTMNAVWFAEGVLWGSVIAGGIYSGKMKKATDISTAAGYIEGKMDAYREMARNPYMVQNKVKKF